MSGYVQYRVIKVTGDVNIAALNALDNEPSADFMNTNVDVALLNYPDNSKFADVEFIDTDSGLGFNIVFTDDTTIDGLTFINEMMAAMESYMPAKDKK